MSLQTVQTSFPSKSINTPPTPPFKISSSPYLFFATRLRSSVVTVLFRLVPECLLREERLRIIQSFERRGDPCACAREFFRCVSGITLLPGDANFSLRGSLWQAREEEAAYEKRSVMD